MAQTIKCLLAMRQTQVRFLVRKIPWRRKWQSTPALLPGKSHGRRSLIGYSPWGRKESDTTERLHFTSLHFVLQQPISRVLPLGNIYWFINSCSISLAHCSALGPKVRMGKDSGVRGRGNPALLHSWFSNLRAQLVRQ